MRSLIIFSGGLRSRVEIAVGCHAQRQSHGFVLPQIFIKATDVNVDRITVTQTMLMHMIDNEESNVEPRNYQGYLDPTLLGSEAQWWSIAGKLQCCLWRVTRGSSWDVALPEKRNYHRPFVT